MYKYSNSSREILDGVGTLGRVVMVQAIKESPHDIIIIEGYRSEARQNKLYRQGRSEKGKIVTYVDGSRVKSKHQERKAIDFAVWEGGKISYNVEKMKEVGEHIKRTAKELGIDIKWGGDWKMKDYPHIEW